MSSLCVFVLFLRAFKKWVIFFLFLFGCGSAACRLRRQCSSSVCQGLSVCDRLKICVCVRLYNPILYVKICVPECVIVHL